MANYSVTDKNKYNKGLLYKESFTMSKMQFINCICVHTKADNVTGRRCNRKQNWNLEPVVESSVCGPHCFVLSSLSGFLFNSFRSFFLTLFLFSIVAFYFLATLF